MKYLKEKITNYKKEATLLMCRVTSEEEFNNMISILEKYDFDINGLRYTLYGCNIQHLFIRIKEKYVSRSGMAFDDDEYTNNSDYLTIFIDENFPHLLNYNIYYIDNFIKLNDFFTPLGIKNYFKKNIKSYESFVSESLLDHLKGPTEEEILNSLSGLKDSDKIKVIIKLGETYYKYLPDNLVVKGYLDCSYNQLTSLPDNLVVDGNLDCSYNQLTSLPDNLVVSGYLDCNFNQLTSLPDNLVVGSSLYCSYNQLTSLPENLVVNGDLYCNDNQLTSLPDNLKIDGDLDCSGNRITSLPDNFIAKYNLYCSNNQLTSLPNNLVVGGRLECKNNKVKLKIPSTAKIKGKIIN